MKVLKTLMLNEDFGILESEFEVREKDLDDSICHEIFSDGVYLFTVSKGGALLFNSSSNKMESAELMGLIKEIIKQI
jgi:hypothetical protein